MGGDPEAANDDLDKLVDPAIAKAIKAKKAARKQQTDFWVLPENWLALQLFEDCFDQPLISLSGRYIGLRNEAIDIEIKRSGLDVDPENWARFRTFSKTAVNALNTILDKRRR